jgi:hypothetical protein
MNMDLRKRFIGSLAMAVQPDNPEKATDALRSMLPLLDRIPDRAWESRAFLEAVIATKRRTIIPALADFALAYGEWVQDHPDAPAIEQEPPKHLSGTDLAWWMFFQRREADGYGPTDGQRRMSRERVLSLVKQESLVAWDAITGGDAPRESPEVRAQMAQAAADAIAFLHAIQEPHGRPQDARAAPPIRRQDGRPLGALSAEHLAEARRNAGMPGR